MEEIAKQFVRKKTQDILHEINQTIALMWWRDKGNNVDDLTESEITDIILDHNEWCKNNPGKIKVNYFPIHDIV